MKLGDVIEPAPGYTIEPWFNEAGELVALSVWHPAGETRHEAIVDLVGASGHQLVDGNADTFTLSPSLLCPDCGAHFWLRSGQVVPA